MKKYIILSAFAAALTLFSCTRESDIISEETPAEMKGITFNADRIDTRTAFGTINSDNTYPVFWQSGDEVAISHNWSSSFVETHYPATISDDGKKASFFGDFTLADGKNTFVVLSPFASAKSQNKGENKMLVEWPSAQTPVLAAEGQPSSPDPAAQILYDRIEYNTKEEVPSSIEMSFKHLSAYLRMRFTNVNLSTSSGNASVLSVSLATEDTPLAGRFQYHFADDADYEHFENNSEAFKIVTASVTSFSEEKDIWLGIRPVALSGKKLIFTISTDKGTLTKEVTLPSNDKYNLSCGSVAAFTVNMNGIPIAEPVAFTQVTDPSALKWGDEIIIAAANSDIALSTTQNTNNRTGTAVTKVENGTKIFDPSSSVDIITLEDGVIPGQFSFRVAEGYLYARNDGTINSNSNILQTIADKTGKENHASWSITSDNGTTRIKANLTEGGSENTTVRPHLRYNSGSNLFTAYDSKNSQSAIAVYARTPENVGNHFVVTMAADGLTVPYEAATFPIYVFGNVSWTATVTGSGATLDKYSGTGTDILTLSIPENQSYNTVSYTVIVSTDAMGVAPAAFSFNVTQEESQVFLLATSPWQLAENDKIIIVGYNEGEGKHYAMGTTQTSPVGKGGYRNSVEVTVENNTIIPGSGVEIISIKPWVNSLYFDLKATSTSAPGYLYADHAYSSDNTNSLRTRESNTDDNSGHWSISIAGGSSVATIRAYETGAESQFNGEIRLNPEGNVFRAYKKTSSMNVVKIYYAPTGIHDDIQASFPVTWTFPDAGASWVSKKDYYIHETGQTGSFVFSDDHQGKVSIVRPAVTSTVAGYESKNWTYSDRFFYSQGMNLNSYWLFEIPHVNNPAGTYSISYKMHSTNAGPKFFTLEYSSDGGETWAPFASTTTNSSWQYGTASSTMSVTYTYILAETTHANREWKDVSDTFSLPAFNGTLLVRARVSSTLRNNNASEMATTSGGDNVIYNPTITFTPD